MDALTAFGSGLVAGLGIAVPLGAIGVLLIQEGVMRGLRRGAPAAVAVGVVDTVYCTGAVALGAVAAPLIARLGRWPAVVGGVALIVIAVLGIRRALRTRVAETEVGEVAPGPSWRRFVLFLGLTAINPATLVYFAAITLGLAGLLRSPVRAALFVAGTGLASVAWQLLLVASGALLRRRTSPRTRTVTALIGNAVVAAFGAAMLLSATA
ncbi:MAG: LysE family transporter [Micromonosporaceae bacterium]|nr:LysE family transporter [Micromonosporaceae bacterium]